MHSLVARLRGRATSQATTTSAHSDDTELTTPDTPTAYHGPSAARMALPRSPVDQKILPQVDELMDSFSQIDLGDTGLSPPPIRKRNSEGLPPRRVLASGSDPGPSGAAAEGDPRPDSPASECSSLPERSVRLSRFSRRVASSGLWSTFGRHDAGTSPRSSRMDQQSAWTRFTFGSVDTLAIPRMSDISRLEGTGTVASSVSVDRYGRPSIASETSSGLPGQSYASWRRSDLLAITPDEPTNERSISPDTTSSRHNSTKRSVITQSSRSTSSPAATVHTPSMQTFEFNSSSPNTFGQVSPPQLSAFVSSVSPPPLPPLSHPELVASMATRSQPVLRDLSNTVTPPLRHWSSAIYPKTYPPRRRHRIDSNDENAAPYSATARRTIRAYASLPRVRQMFRADERVSRRGSQKSLRRDSAEWNAAQATSGVLVGDAGEHFGWPAAVSHEMVRLSLGGTALGNGRGTQAALATAADPDIIPSPRVHNVPAGSGEPAARPCSPLLSPVAAPAPRQGQSDGGESLAQLPSNADNSLSRTPGGVAEAERGMDVGESSTLREDGDRTRQNATLPRAAGPRTPRKSILRQSSSAFLDQEQGSSFPQQQNVKSTPPSRRSSMRHPARHSSEPTLHSVLETPVGKGKRKAEEIDITPPDIRKQHATFVIPTQQRRIHRLSESSHAPPAYQQRKRVRLSSTSSPATSPGHSRPGTAQSASNAGSTSNRNSVPPSPAVRAISRTSNRPGSFRGSARSMQQSVASAVPPSVSESRRDRRSLSEGSIPVGAIVAPHPPSLSRSSVYHMRDPRRPPRVQPTSWALSRRTGDDEGSPVHAWIFFIGFVLFPLWWVASFWRIPETRRVGGTDTEKAVTLDDPQVEHDARSWRFRCRIMSAVSLITYIPFIVLVAIYAPR